MSLTIAFSEVQRPASKSSARILFDKLLHLLTVTDTTLFEFCSSTTLVVMGLTLAHPAESLTDTVPLFRLMRYLAPEWAWSAVFLIAGVIQSIANLRLHPKARRLAAGLACFAFGTVACCGMAPRPISLLGMVLGVQAAVDAFVFVRLGVRGES